MKKGFLSEYFQGVATKELRDVEVDELKSNQHEINGVEGLRNILGTPTDPMKFDTTFVYMTDGDDDPLTEEAWVTFYDARSRHKTRTEYRLYFPTNSVMQLANPGDMLFIARKQDGSLLAIVAERGSTIGNQLAWLFGCQSAVGPSLQVRDELETEQDRIRYASAFILEQIGVVVHQEEPSLLEDMLDRFQGGFPRTTVFSEYARTTLDFGDDVSSPDELLMLWMDREEVLFRTLEKHMVGDWLQQRQLDTLDTDGFIGYAMSVIQRRRSRVGYALENHVEELLKNHRIRYARKGVVTENNAKPDFLFPGMEEYRDSKFPAMRLSMLGVKATCKDRWRQVLSEAERIPSKHLLTLEAAISENQTSEMRSNLLQLVVPKGLHESYTESQRRWILSLQDFFDLVKERQCNAPE